MDAPEFVGFWLKGDSSFGQCGGDFYESLAPADAASVVDESEFVCEGVVETLCPLWKFSFGGLVVLAGSVAAESLMGSLLVVHASKAIECALLLGESRCGWLAGSVFKCAVKAFESAVLFGMPGFDTFVGNRHFMPPKIERSEGSGGARSERGTVVGTNGARESKLCEG